MENAVNKSAKKRTTIIVTVLLVIALIGGIIGGVFYWAYSWTATNYSEEEHIERISNLVQENYIGGDSKYAMVHGLIQPRSHNAERTVYTDFKVYPLYDENEEFTYFCIVEFEPSAYLYVKIWNKEIGHSMYSRCETQMNEPWKRYRIRENGETPPPYDDVQWVNKTTSWGEPYDETIFYEANESGEEIIHTENHFRAANIGETERRYLLSVVGDNGIEKIPAVKRGDKYLNLISMEEIEYSATLSAKECPCTSVFAPMPKRAYDL